MKETWNSAEISEDIKPVNYVNSDTWNAAELNEAIDLFGIKYPVDTWNPAELDEKARNIINDITSTKTITGNPISFKTINGGYAKSCEVTFSPIQSGSGDPSPENVRPISGWNSLHLYQDTEQTETPETTHTVTFPSTVYGGEYEFVEGKGKNTNNLVDMGDLTWTAYPPLFLANIPGLKFVSGNNNIICSAYKTSESQASANVQDKEIYTRTSGGVAGIGVKDTNSSYTTAAEFKAAMSGVQLCYELATPQEITLTPETIALLKGVNVMWTDGDFIELKYTKLALPEDSDGLSLNQKVKKAIEIIKGKEIKEETKKSTTKGRRKKS